MNIDFELYRIFYTVANNLNITKASKELNISQPAISKSIKNLEDQLGGQLFVRTKRGVILTEEGKEFYNYIKQAINFISNAENKFSELVNLETGTIRIGISTILTKVFLLPYLEKFHKLYPGIRIEITTNITNELINMLKNGLLDIVILNVSDKKYDNDLEIIKCKKIHDCFIVNKDYKDLINKKISINDILNYPLIVQMKGSNTRTFLDNLLLKNNIVIKPSMELSSYSLVIEFAKIGLGVGYATVEYIKDEINKKELFPIDLVETIPPRYIGIALSKNHLPNFSSKKMIEIITEKKTT